MSFFLPVFSKYPDSKLMNNKGIIITPYKCLQVPQ